ncbi:unnamed protein product [marine sediment metagenome]|uniref:Transcriptional activator HlyU n=1 Tax=marine sediment metagenome TaxID=412755 RepID=X1B9P5_9ZZZZ
MNFLAMKTRKISTPAEPEPEASIEHEGYVITSMPMAEGGQFRLCAEITREIDGEMKTHRMIRADIFPNRDEAIEASYRKAKQMIKEQGDRFF